MEFLGLACIVGIVLGIVLAIVIVVIIAREETTCPQCKSIIPKTATVCSDCGRDIEECGQSDQPQQQEGKKLRYSETGNLDAVCPYCNTELEKKPGGKKKCPHCGEYIYVMARPFDDERVSVTAEQREILSEEWSHRHMRERWAPDWLAAYDEAQKMLEERFGFTPARTDIFWAVLNRKVFGRTLEGERWPLGHEALEALRYLRVEGELDVVVDALLNADPTPAVAGALRDTLSTRAQLARKDEDWQGVVSHLERYLSYAARWRQYCIDHVNQEPPPLTDSDKKLLEQARDND